MKKIKVGKFFIIQLSFVLGILVFLTSVDWIILIIFSALLISRLGWKITIISTSMFILGYGYGSIFWQSAYESSNNASKLVGEQTYLSVHVNRLIRESRFTKSYSATTDAGLIVVETSLLPMLQPGDILQLTTNCTGLPVNHNSLDLNQAYMIKNNTMLHCKVSSLKRIGSTDNGFVEQIRNIIKGRIKTLYLQPTAGLIEGLLIGDTSDLDPQFDDSMKLLGLSHITAFSGGNFALILGYMGLESSLLGRKTRKLLTLFSVFIILLLVGVGNFSAFRAFIFILISLVYKIFGRKVNKLNVVAGSLFMVSLYNPFILTDVGYLLSLFAVTSIILLANPLYNILYKSFNKFISSLIAPNIAATLSTLPLQVAVFGSANILTIPISLIAIPLFGCISLASIFTLFLSLILPEIAALLAAAIDQAVTGIIDITSMIAGYAESFYTDDLIILVTYYLSLLIITLLILYKGNHD